MKKQPSICLHLTASLPDELDSSQEFSPRVQALLEQLEAALSQEFGGAQVGTAVHMAPLYTQVHDRCPDCGGRLQLFELEPDFENGAYAQAACHDCDWFGQAEFRLIDLFDMDGKSAVSDGSILPEHYPYP